MAHRPPFDQQNGDGRHQFNLSHVKRQPADYGNSEAGVDTTEDHYKTTPFPSWDRVSISASWPASASFLQPQEQMQGKEAFLVQEDPIERSLGKMWHTTNQYILPQTIPDVSTVSATRWLPTHSFPTHSFPTHSFSANSNSYQTPFVSPSVKPTIRHAEHAALPLRYVLPDVTIETTTASQVCFGMASHHRLSLFSTVLI
jgi:hypothetical protein